MRILTVNLFDLFGVPEPFFAFDQFLQMLEQEGFRSNDERLCCIGGFVLESWAPDQGMQCYPWDGSRYDLSKLSGTWAARLAYRIGALCDVGMAPVLWARDWCGRLYGPKWAVNPHNKANNRQKRGGSTPEDMTRVELVETIEKPLLDMVLDAIEPKHRKLIHIGVSNEPPMFKWSSAASLSARPARLFANRIRESLPTHGRSVHNMVMPEPQPEPSFEELVRLSAQEWAEIKRKFPVMDSEAALLNVIHKKFSKARVHASCSEETFHAYGDGVYIRGVGAIHCHNLYREADCKRAYGEPDGPIRGFQPGGKYYGKYWPVIPDCDGTKGVYYDLTPTDFVHVIRRYDGQGLLWNLDKKHLKHLTIPPTQADWDRMIAQTRPYIRAMLEV